MIMSNWSDKAYMLLEGISKETMEQFMEEIIDREMGEYHP